MDADDWLISTGGIYGNFLASLGTLVDNQPGRYLLPNGATSAGANPSSALGTGTGADGTVGRSTGQVAITLADLAEPSPKTGKVRIIVRATKTAIEETTDREFIVEFTDAGAIVGDRPNQAHVRAISLTGLQVTVDAMVLTNDKKTSATYIDLYVVASPGPIVLASAQASAALPTELNTLQSVNVSYTVGAPGWYVIAVLARDANGVRSGTWIEERHYLISSAPGAVTTLQAKVIRGRGVTNNV